VRLATSLPKVGPKDVFSAEDVGGVPLPPRRGPPPVWLTNAEGDLRLRPPGLGGMGRRPLWSSVCGVVGLLDGGTNAAAVGDLVSVGAGPFADLG